MPIKYIIENQESKAEFSIGRDVELLLCSKECLLNKIKDDARIVRTGQTSATALTVILNEDRLLIPLAGIPRTFTHILGTQQGNASARVNWEKLIGCRHPALMPVYGVCDCMAEIQILDGEEFEDASTTPAWKKVHGIVGRAAHRKMTNQSVTFDQWRIWMSELAQGLAELENLGLAHGDPYPFNAVRNTQGATWVDFGHLTDDPEQRLKDAWAFVLFTVLHTLGRISTYSPSLLKNLAAALAQADQPGCFERIRLALVQQYSDQVFFDDIRIPESIFVEEINKQSSKVFGNSIISELLMKASVQYFSAFLHHIQRGNQFFTAFNVERQRHRFQEEEMLRLTMPRAEHFNRLDEQSISLKQAILERDSQIVELTQRIVQQDEKNISLQQALLERDSQLVERTLKQDEHNAPLHQLASESGQQADQLRRELDTLSKSYEQILHSHSWQWTRPLRSVADLLNYDDWRQALYRVTAKIGRMKARGRAVLAPVPQPVSPMPDSGAACQTKPISQFAHRANGHAAVMRAECCGLIDGLVSVVLPVYNQADLIAESIDSVLNQSYQNFELIIINDGSSDGVEAVLDRYVGHPKIRCYTQSNQRLPKALSNGFDFARGEFRTWTSADNIMEPKMLEQLVNELRENPTLGMIYADYYAIDDRGELLQDQTWRAHNRPDPGSAEIRLPRTTEYLNIVQDNFIGPCFMYRGWVGLCVGDYDTQLGIEDYDYWMRINAFFPARHLGSDSLLYRYRVHDNTLSAQAKEHKILDKVQMLMEYEKERAAYYKSPILYAADQKGADWLTSHGFSREEIVSIEGGNLENAILVLGCDAAKRNIAQLLSSRQPIALICQKTDTDYHKLRQLLCSGHCIALVDEGISAERIRLVSNCPKLDSQSSLSLVAVSAFAKNLLFVRATRSGKDMHRVPPHMIRSKQGRHVLLQVDSFTQGGMENVVIDLALSLQKYGYRVTIANLGKSGDAAVKAENNGLQVENFSANKSDDAYLAWLRRNQVDLVNAHYSVYGATVCHSVGIPFVQTIHNSYVWLDPDKIAKYREADCYTTQYICVSVTAARYADIVLELDVAKMCVVPNGIDPHTVNADNFSENRASLRKSWGVNGDAPVFINVASIMATKAQLPLVRAFAKVVKQQKNALLILLGANMEAPYHKAIEEAIRSLQLQKNVLLAGYERDVAPYYHAADIFVLPSYWEGWSLSLGEAMANGLGCVITDVGSAYEFEGCENVEIVAPPFEDIKVLDHRNLGHFINGEDAAFEERLAEAMLKLSRRPRGSINLPLAERLDCNLAYRAYADFFASL